MPRPTTKNDLIDLSTKNYAKLLALVASYSEEEQHAEFPPGTLNRNIRDVLAHLHEWHTMVRDWYETDKRGEKPEIPGRGYTWRTLPELNKLIREQYSTHKLEKAKALLDGSFQDIQQLIASHSEEELFERKRYAWTGSTNLASYLISCTSSHYDWAIKLIRRAKKKPK